MGSLIYLFNILFLICREACIFYAIDNKQGVSHRGLRIHIIAGEREGEQVRGAVDGQHSILSIKQDSHTPFVTLLYLYHDLAACTTWGDWLAGEAPVDITRCYSYRRDVELRMLCLC